MQEIDGRIVGEVVGGADVVDVVAELSAKGDGIGVVVVLAVARLVAISGVEGDRLHGLRHPVEEAVAPQPRLGPRGVAVGEGVAGVVDDDPIDRDRDRPTPEDAVRRLRIGGVERDLVDRVLVLGQVHKRLRLGGIAPPRPHHVARQVRRVHVDRVRGRRAADLLDVADNRRCLAVPRGVRTGRRAPWLPDDRLGELALPRHEPRIEQRRRHGEHQPAFKLFDYARLRHPACRGSCSAVMPFARLQDATAFLNRVVC